MKRREYLSRCRDRGEEGFGRWVGWGCSDGQPGYHSPNVGGSVSLKRTVPEAKTANRCLRLFVLLFRTRNYLGVVVGLKESRRPGGGLECPAVEEMHRLAYVPRRKPLASSPIHKPHPQDGSGTKAADRLLTEARQHCSATRPEDLGGAEYPSRTVFG
jgi:hypothetical protein